MNTLYNILLVTAAFFVIWMLIEAQTYELYRVKLKNKKIPDSFRNFKIIFLSDIHYGRFFRADRLNKIVEKINKLNPDIIIIGGDYLDVPVKSKRNMEEYINVEFSILSKLKAQKGIYTVLGNHDYCIGKALILDKIKANSFKLLLNNKEIIYIGKDAIELIGLDDLIEGKPAINMLKEKSKRFSIIISHNPDFYSKYEKNINYDLGLSGHTHGGQVTFFGLYAPYTSSKYGQRYVKRRLIEKENGTIIISRGIGNGALPIRFFAKPDFVEVTLKN